MKLGILLDKELIRKDILNLIMELRKNNELIIFCKKELTTREYPQIEGIVIRPIITKPTTPKKGISKFLYSYFGYLPKSLNNYKVVTYFTFQKIQNKYKRIYAEKIFFPFILYLPKFISFDRYLKLISGTDASNINDIDNFLLLTHINDVEFLSNLINQKKNIKIYLYSWDHSCKLKHLPRNVDYLVWNKEVGSDLSILNKIDSKLITIIGSTQLAILNEYKNTYPKQEKEKYIYFGFSTGYLSLIEQEIAIVKLIAKELNEIDKSVKLKVRTYPMQKDQSVYDELYKIKNVEVEDTKGIGALNDEQLIFQKYNSLSKAIAFFHYGTTLGLECCFFNTPSFIINFSIDNLAKDNWSILNFTHQYQNEKYLLLKDYPNVVQNKEELKIILKKILIANNTDKYLKYNQKIQETFTLNSIQKISQLIIDSY